MASTKTAISIEKSVLDQIDDISKKLNISRSRFFAIAAEEFIKHYKAQELVKSINDAYDEPDVEEQIIFENMRRSIKKLVKEKW